MDTGPSAEVLTHNLAVMNVNLQRSDFIMLSHGHYDHTGGLIQALGEMEAPTLVLAHPEAFKPKLVRTPMLKSVGSPYTIATVEAAGGVPLLSRNPLPVAEGVATSGEIDRRTAFEQVTGFWKVEDGRLVEDRMPDDQALYFDVEDRGLAVVTGCAHAGIINTIKQGLRLMRLDEVYAVIGGFHLKDVSNERIFATIEELESFTPEIIAPCHCTGATTVKHLSRVFRRRCHVLRTGDHLEI